MQTDDTSFLASQEFAKLENEQLTKAKIKAKPVEKLTKNNPWLFNGGRIIQEDTSITLVQKDQGKRIEMIDLKSPSHSQDYLVQRVRGDYIATTCQLEAAFHLSVAAQYQNPNSSEVHALNRCLRWQKENLYLGIRFVPFQLECSKLFVFVDGSFVNKKDLSSQIGFIIILASETIGEGAFTIHGNIVHWTLIKCKRITRSVLASELYAMVRGIEIAIALRTTLNIITNQLEVEKIPIIICTHSFSLYECMVKLGTTSEKRLVIDIMAIRQAYERRELSEIRWINDADNPADALTKANPSKALQVLVDDNSLHIKIQRWVNRTNE